ncbi:MAG: hypothetical protein LUG90_03075, partial [Clostridiaceae bacterium]|nr:hypothetical protein [Clostridiaceae bacterium]
PPALFLPEALKNPPKLGEALRPRFPGETKTPKSWLKLLTKATFYNFVSLQVYPVIGMVPCLAS